MCYSCYEEAGKPAIINEKTKKAAELIIAIYIEDNCDLGGYAHIVVDDWNLDDLSIDYCIGVANEGSSDITEEGKQACLSCLNHLKTLSEDERYSAMALAENFIN